MKPSMFNFYFENKNEELILYNSYVGYTGISVIHKSYKNIVTEWLRHENIVLNDNLFQELCKKGFFVKDDIDEKLRRNSLISEYIHNNELDLTIHTTEECNFRCRYCCLNFNSKIMSREIQNRIISYIRKHINKYTGVSISWFGGEPLLGLEVIKYISRHVIDICKQARKKYTGYITTNGFLLNQNIVQQLLEYRVYNFTVTLDGLRDLHDQYRVLRNGHGTFDRIIENLLNIKTNYKSNAIRVNIRTNITNKILGREREYYEYYDKMFGDDKRFNMFIKPVGDWGGKRIKKIKGSLIQSRDISNVYMKLSELDGKIKFFPNIYDLNYGGTSCPARMKNKFTIGVDGNINKCDDSKKEISLGYISEAGDMIIDIDMHNRWTTFMTTLDEECDNCFYSCSCFGVFCPKYSIKNNQKSCALDLNELRELINLYVNSDKNRTYINYIGKEEANEEISKT